LQSESLHIEVGNIVKWWTRYDDDIVRDAGTGLVLNIQEREYHSVTQDEVVKYKNFDVYRFKINDIMSINQRDIEFLKE
jgi:hypothetical protein